MLQISFHTVCRCAECRYAECHYAECHNAEYGYAERFYAECCFVECCDRNLSIEQCILDTNAGKNCLKLPQMSN